MKNLLSIKEFARLSDIEISTLRYWDEIGLFPPAKRSSSTNYRYYTPQQIVAVNFIKVLSGLGVPLKTIKRMEDERTPDTISELTEKQEKLMDLKMQRLQECYSIVHTRRGLINRGSQVIDVDKIAVSDEEEVRYIRGQINHFKKGEGFYEPFVLFCSSAKELRINLQFPVGAMHNSWEEFQEAPGEPHYFLSLDPTGNEARPAGRYVVGYTHGYYGEFGDLAERMTRFIEENELQVTGPVYATYLHDEVSTRDTSKYLAQVCVAVGKKKRAESP
jgi:DNA-binding transcriptional MerR regulator